MYKKGEYVVYRYDVCRVNELKKGWVEFIM